MSLSVPQRSLTTQLTGSPGDIVGAHGRLQSESEDELTEQNTTLWDRLSGVDPTKTSQSLDNQHSEQENEETILKLAKHFSTVSGSNQQNPFDAQADGPLDPDSATFDAKAWARAVYNLHLQDDSESLSKTMGVAYKNLNVHGFGTATDFQKTIGNIFLDATAMISKLRGHAGSKVQILRNFEGIIHSGEMLCVLGPPGSGCSTLLRTIAGEMHGLYIDDQSYLNYQGITPKQMRKQFRGEAIYTAEIDAHFPMLSVRDTLYFAALARAPRIIPGGVSREQYAELLMKVVMTVFGIAHTANTRVGDNFIRGVSGGERKRVSIAEAFLSDAPLQCWDNSTRGLDSANAVEFCKVLAVQAQTFGTSSAVAIYQAPQAAYEHFKKVTVLYEGRQIYFGKTSEARSYFEDLGFVCPENQTTPDFLTSMTSPSERLVRPGYEGAVPRTADDFASAWQASAARRNLLVEIEKYDTTFPFHGPQARAFTESRQLQQAKHQRVKSPFTLSYTQQVRLCLTRSFKLLRADPTITLVQLAVNFIQFLIVGSVSYNLPSDTSSFFRRGITIFLAIILNAFASILEILTLYAKRPIVEKHNRYALYHPSAESIAAMITDIPYKIVNSIGVNLTVYFMSNLNRTPGAFFFFLLISFFTTLTMSMLFRFMGSSTKTVTQAIAPTAVILLAIVLYTGFAIPIPGLLGWSRWINYVVPTAYAFESLFINELAGRTFPCAQLVPHGPGYDSVDLLSRACDVVGGVAGEDLVSGTRHLIEAYQFQPSNKWRNLGILIAFAIFFMMCTLITSEVVASAKSKGEVLVFQRGRAPASMIHKQTDDVERPATTSSLHTQHENEESTKAKVTAQTSVFHWRNVSYEVKIKDETRRILDHVDGWVKPGTLTALMGVSGAGKTTLLDTLACRITMGVVTGDMLVDGKLRDASFQRKTGYVQQQDLHLATATVREALSFSALLRQPASTPRKEKLDYVEEVIDLLEMRMYADAIIGELGEGLNVEQRKRLTIGVELAARPQLLLFLDEPTSGLDSQTSWSICNLMRKLVNHGQAVLCTIHQPSAMLFQRFDRLLLLAKGGRTVYFGEIGQGSQILVDYFVSKGAVAPTADENPAEWMLGVIGATPGTRTEVDWPQLWRDSAQKQAVQAELDRLEGLGSNLPDQTADSSEYKESQREFAMPLAQQTLIVTKRVFQQYWRSPTYIYSKAFLVTMSTLLIGFTFFHVERTQQGVRSQMFAVFAVLTLFLQMVEQIVPFFVTQRSLYEVRERPSKTYSWKAFMFANIVVEIPFNTVIGLIMFLAYWYPVGYYQNASLTDSTHSRALLACLYIWTYNLFISTFAHLMIAGISDAEAACNLSNLIGFLFLLFVGIAARVNELGWWVWLYRLNPFTYLTEGLLTVGLAHAPMYCSPRELLRFSPANNASCAEYLSPYISRMGGAVLNPEAVGDVCEYCPVVDTDVFLKFLNMDYGNRWRNWGFMWVFIGVNAVGAVALYWLCRVPKGVEGGKKGEKKGEEVKTKEAKKGDEGEKVVE